MLAQNLSIIRKGCCCFCATSKSYHPRVGCTNAYREGLFTVKWSTLFTWKIASIVKVTVAAPQNECFAFGSNLRTLTVHRYMPTTNSENYSYHFIQLHYIQQYNLKTMCDRKLYNHVVRKKLRRYLVFILVMTVSEEYPIDQCDCFLFTKRNKNPSVMDVLHPVSKVLVFNLLQAINFRFLAA